MIVYRIQQTLLGKGKASDTISAQTALNVALFPLVYFFGGLFYTDIWSTVFVLAAYLATLRGNRWVSGVFCWVSLWFRQTNVVWVVFMAGVYGVGKLQELQWLESLGEKEETHKLKVALFLDPRQWRKIKIHNPPLNQATTFSGNSHDASL